MGVAHRMQHRRQEVLLETFWALGLKVSWALGLKVSSCKEKVSSCKDSERSADEVRRWVGVAHRMQHRRLTVPPPLDTHEKGLLFSLDTLFRTPCR